MLSSNGDCDLAVSHRLNKVWNIFRELKIILYAKRIGLNVEGKVFEACLRSRLMWRSLDCLECMRKLMKIEQRMCAVRLQD